MCRYKELYKISIYGFLKNIFNNYVWITFAKNIYVTKQKIIFFCV